MTSVDIIDYPSGQKLADAEIRIQDAISGEDQTNDHLVARPPANQFKAAVAAENAACTASLSALGASTGGKHVLTSLQASIIAANGAPTAADPVTVQLRDGTTTVAQWKLGVPTVAGAMNQLSLSNLWFVGTAETLMIVEFTGAGGADTFECASFTYVDIV